MGVHKMDLYGALISVKKRSLAGLVGLAALVSGCASEQPVQSNRDMFLDSLPRGTYRLAGDDNWIFLGENGYRSSAFNVPSEQNGVISVAFEDYWQRGVSTGDRLSMIRWVNGIAVEHTGVIVGPQGFATHSRSTPDGEPIKMDAAEHDPTTPEYERAVGLLAAYQDWIYSHAASLGVNGRFRREATRNLDRAMELHTDRLGFPHPKRVPPGPRN